MGWSCASKTGADFLVRAADGWGGDAAALAEEVHAGEAAQVEHGDQDSLSWGEFGFGACAGGYQAFVTTASARHVLALKLQCGSVSVSMRLLSCWWVTPGVREDLREWKLTRIVWVADRGFASQTNRRFLQRAGGHYILGEKIRSGSPAAQAALSRQGRYATVADNMQVKQVQLLDTADRFVICHNPDQATRDAAIRTDLLAQLGEANKDTDKLSPTKRAELRGRLSTKPGLHCFLRVTPNGLLRIDKAAIKAEERMGGKFLVHCSDPHLSAEDMAPGYKQLLEVERGWRDMKTITDLRPVYHRKEDRIRGHVLLCWLALLLIRIAETTCDDTWLNLREELERTHFGTFAGPAGTFRQRTETTPAQRVILAKLGLTEPKHVIILEPGTSA